MENQTHWWLISRLCVELPLVVAFYLVHNGANGLCLGLHITQSISSILLMNKPIFLESIVLIPKRNNCKKISNSTHICLTIVHKHFISMLVFLLLCYYHKPLQCKPLLFVSFLMSLQPPWLLKLNSTNMIIAKHR